MLIGFVIITLIYLLLILSFNIGFNKVQDFVLEEIEPKTSFSVIVPFKNEAENLPPLLNSISKLNYPNNLFEVILVNDASTDASVEIIKKVLDTKFLKENFTRTDIKVINNIRETNSPKKDAIATAIKLAKHEWIVITDADCIVPKYWLDSFDDFIQKNSTNFIAAPVTYYEVNSFFKRFQTLDFLSLIGATIGGFGIKKPFLCNGANLAYRKSFFEDLKGFEGNTNIASGDDIFLLEKAIKQTPEKVHYLKSEKAVVLTKPQPDLKSLISQRVRWAAKTSSYNNWFGKLTGLIVLLMNATIICTLLFTLMGLINPMLLAYLFIIKLSIDFLLIYKTVRFLNQEQYLISYGFVSILYPFFSVYVATLSVFKGYKWKGESYRR